MKGDLKRIMMKNILCAILGLILFIPVSMAYLDGADFYGVDFYRENIKVTNSFIYQWDIIKIKISNPVANVDINTRDRHLVRLNTSHSEINITVIETDVNTGLFEGEFQTAETSSSNITSSIYPYPRLNCSDGDNITAKVDLDDDGNSAMIKTTFNVKDNILVFKSPSVSVGKADKTDYSPLYFKENDTIYVVIYAKAFAVNKNINISVVGRVDSMLLELTEDTNYNGKYNIDFSVVSTTTNSATRKLRAMHDNSIKLESDIASDGKKDSDIPIAIDNVPPHILRVFPNDKSFRQNSTAQDINITLIEAHPKGSIDLFYFRANGPEDYNNNNILDVGEYTKDIVSGTGSFYQTTINDSFVQNGKNISIWIYVEDAAGNALTEGGSSSAPLITYTIDNLKPTLSINANSDINDTLLLNVAANGTTSPVASLRYSIFNSSFSINESLSCSAEYCMINHSKDAMNIPVGVFNLTVFVKDSAGNEENSTVQINSLPYFNITNTAISNPTDTRRATLIDLDITLKGSSLKFKLLNLTSSDTLGYNDCSQCFFLIYTDNSGSVITIPIYNDYTQVSNFFDRVASTQGKEIRVEFKINASNKIGNYYGTYYVKSDSLEISRAFNTVISSITTVTTPTTPSINASIKIIHYESIIKITQGESKNTTIVVNNNGKAKLTTTMSITGMDYSIQSFASALNPNENGTFIIQFTAPTAIKNHTITATVSGSNDTTTVSDGVIFTVTVLPSNQTISSINQTYYNYLNEIVRLNETISYLESKGVDIETLRKLLDELMKKLKDAKKAIDDNDYSKAKGILDETNIDELKNKVESLSGFDFMAFIPYIVVVIILVIIVYLFWPTKD